MSIRGVLEPEVVNAFPVACCRIRFNIYVDWMMFRKNSSMHSPGGIGLTAFRI